MSYGVDLTRVPPLADMIRADELAELCAAVVDADDVHVWITETGGVVLWGRGDVPPVGARRPITYAGDVLGEVCVVGTRAAASASVLGVAIELLAHQGYGGYLASATHEATMSIHVAELSERNARLERAVRRLADVDRLKSAFLATMSHELWTPLTAVIGYAEMLLEGIAGPVSEEQREYLGVVLGKADQLRQLISALLDVSQLDGDTLAISQESVSLDEVVRAAVREQQPYAQQRNLTIRVTVVADFCVVGDKARLRQAVGGLVSNAIKFSLPGGEIDVELAADPAGRGAPDAAIAHVTVRDRGIGIAAADAARVFEPFFQVDASSTRAYGGSGLGLALTRAFVEAHGGAVRIETAAGEGSTFTVVLPVASA